MLPGCKQDEIVRFDPDRQMVAFRRSTSAISFTGVAEGENAIVEIPFNVVGNVSDRERRAKFDFIPDSTTVPIDKFTILDAIVPAGELNGVLRVEIARPWEIGDEEEKDLRIWLITANGDDFFAGPEERQNRLNVSPRLVMPETWFTAQARAEGLGQFSPAYYAWIIEATGYTEFPMTGPIEGINLDQNGNPQKWTTYQKRNFLNNLRFLLAERNAEVGSPLLHDYGKGKGQEVVVGKNEGEYTPLE